MQKKYDVVIIGAGIGGLVCGCYLAKAGLKVLIVEKNDKAGGYCTSFERDGYTFDVGAHYLGSLRDGGILFKILKELELLDRIKFITNDPTDRIITPDKTIFIRKDKNDTKKELIAHFPKEKENIEDFFKFIFNNNFLYIISKTKRITFKELLDNFFKDYKLKTILSILLGNLNLSPSKASALISIILFKEFIFDGGYYPKGGIQVLSDLLAQRFKEYGGELILSTQVTGILAKSRIVRGIKLETGEVISSRYVVSNVDATYTFRKLLDCSTQEAEKVEKLTPSFSVFSVWMGLKDKIKITPPHYVTWFFSTYNIEEYYSQRLNLFEREKIEGALIVFPSSVDDALAPQGRDTIRVLVFGKYAGKEVWNKYKEDMYKMVIKDILTPLFSNIQKQIEIREIATPYTFYKFTLNREGALFGWASTVEQCSRKVFPPETSIKNLYLVGHWAINGVGHSSIAGVATTGKYIIREMKNKSL